MEIAKRYEYVMDIAKPCREIGQSFEASLWEGKLVYNKLEIFWMTNKAII